MRIRRVLAVLVCGLLAACGDDSSSSTQAPSQIELTQITVGDLVFDARVAGPEKGEVVILLHGFPETSYEWRSQLLALGDAGYLAVAPDQRGYSPGARPEDVADYSVEFLAQDVIGMADVLGAKRFHIVGHDWGAVVTWEVAGRFPDRVISMTSLSIPHPDAFAAELADPDSCQYQASGYFDLFTSDRAEAFFLRDDQAFLRTIYQGVDDEAVEVYLDALATPEAIGAALNWYRANVGSRNQLTPPLGTVVVPTLFVWSDMDFAICREGAEQTADFVDAPYRFEVLSGVNHWVPETAAEEVNRLLQEHLGTY